MAERCTEDTEIYSGRIGVLTGIEPQAIVSTTADLISSPTITTGDWGVAGDHRVHRWGEPFRDRLKLFEYQQNHVPVSWTPKSNETMLLCARRHIE